MIFFKSSVKVLVLKNNINSYIVIFLFKKYWYLRIISVINDVVKGLIIVDIIVIKLVKLGFCMFWKKVEVILFK